MKIIASTLILLSLASCAQIEKATEKWKTPEPTAQKTSASQATEKKDDEALTTVKKKKKSKKQSAAKAATEAKPTKQ